MRAFALAFGSLLFLPAIAEAQLIIVPPVVSANAKTWEKNIGAEILKKIDGASVPRVKLDKAKADRFRECKNTLSCLAEEAGALSATHFLHTIVGRRGNDVKVQFTLVAVTTAKPVAQQRMSATAKKAKVIASIKSGMDVILAEIAKVPELRPGGKGSEPLAVFTPPVTKPEPTPPPVTKPEPNPPVVTKPEPTPPVTPEPAKIEPEPAVTTEEKLEPVPIKTRASEGLLVREEAPKPGPNWLAWGTMGGGVALAGAGTIMLVLAGSDISARNETPQVEAERRQELTDSAGTKQNLGVMFLLTGGAAIATGAVFHLLGIGADEPRDGSGRAFLIGPTGAYVTF